MKINTNHLGLALTLSGFSFGGAEIADAQDQSPNLNTTSLANSEHKLSQQEIEKIDRTYLGISALVGIGFTWGAIRHLNKRENLQISASKSR